MCEGCIPPPIVEEVEPEVEPPKIATPKVV